ECFDLRWIAREDRRDRPNQMQIRRTGASSVEISFSENRVVFGRRSLPNPMLPRSKARPAPTTGTVGVDLKTRFRLLAFLRYLEHERETQKYRPRRACSPERRAEPAGA